MILKANFVRFSKHEQQVVVQLLKVKLIESETKKLIDLVPVRNGGFSGQVFKNGVKR